jgi:hypothetical protein
MEGRDEHVREYEAAAVVAVAAVAAVAAAAQGGGGSGLYVSAHSFRAAVELLEGSRQNPLRSLVLVERDAASGGGDDDDDDGARLFFFRRFVALLEHPERSCFGLEFYRVPWSVLSRDEAERLFGSVLPGHRTLHAICFRQQDVPPRLLENSRFFASRSRSP